MKVIFSAILKTTPAQHLGGTLKPNVKIADVMASLKLDAKWTVLKNELVEGPIVFRTSDMVGFSFTQMETVIPKDSGIDIFKH